MAQYSTSELKNGTKVILDNDPCNIISNEFIKPGKGQAFNRIKLRNLKTGKVLEKTFKSGDSLEAADVVDLNVQYLYCDGSLWHFMNPTTYEQYSLSKIVIAQAVLWLKEQDMCQLTLWNNEPIAIITQNFVILKIISTDPGVRGDTATGGSKPATLETGAIVKVPLFLQEGELIKIDTRTGEYVSRARE